VFAVVFENIFGGNLAAVRQHEFHGFTESVELFVTDLVGLSLAEDALRAHQLLHRHQTLALVKHLVF